MPREMICGICNKIVKPLDAHMGRLKGKLDVYHIDCWNKELEESKLLAKAFYSMAEELE